MTKYSYTVTYNEGDITMLKAALELMIKHCQQKIDEGVDRAPYVHHKESAQNVLKRLRVNKNQMSSNNFNNNR